MAAIDPLASIADPDRWRSRLIASRSRENTEYTTVRWEQIRFQFRGVTALTRSLLRSPLEFPILRQLADHALQLSQLVFEELNAAAQSDGTPATPELVAALLNDNRQLLNIIAGQQDLLSDLCSETEPLRAFVESALRGELSAWRWKAWLDELPDRFSRDSASLPLAGVLFEESLARCEQLRPQWMVQAIGSAYLAADVAGKLLDHDPLGPRWLIAAALLQDVGLWSTSGRPKQGRSDLLNRDHPSIGAAILNASTGCPAEIMQLVGMHEERIDGSGLPRRLSGQNLPHRSQVLGLIARFCKLLHAGEVHAESVATGKPVAVQAGLKLWREVHRGAFTEVLAGRFLEAVLPGLTDCVVAAFDQQLQMFIEPRHAMPDPHHDLPPKETQPAVPTPAFIRRRRRSTPGSRLSATAR